MNSLIESAMVSSDLLYFLLTIPFVVMAATLSRHLLGLKTLGIYVIVSMAYIVGFSLRYDSLRSAAIGVGMLLFLYYFSYFIKKLTVELNLHYFSRVSVVITMISILLLIIFMVAGRFIKVVDYLDLNMVQPFTVLIAVFLSEHFSSHQTQKGIKKSRELFFWSLILTTVLGLLLSWSKFESFILDYPFITILFMIATLIAGRYKGVRLSELLRFKDIRSERLND